MLVYPDYPASLSKLSLKKSRKRAAGYEVRKTFLHLTLSKTIYNSNLYRKDGESTGKHLTMTNVNL